MDVSLMQMQTPLFPDDPAPGEFPMPLGETPTVCTSCKTAIVWTTTPNGKAIPLDLGHVRTLDGVRYAMTHFVTCPHARQWRKVK